MVRNTTGGTKTKGLARKHQSSGGSSAHVRVPQCEEEQFAYVSKMLGNGMCEVYIGEKSTRLIGHIRNKFRGRQKRHNQIVSNSIVLVGLRDWESTLKNCDILCIYEDNEINQLKNKPGIGIEHVIRMQLTNTHTHDAADDNQYGIDFTNEAVDTEETDETNKKSNAATFKVEESSIDVDDI